MLEWMFRFFMVYGFDGFKYVLIVFVIYMLIAFPITYPIFKYAKNKIYLFALPILLFIISYVLEVNGQSRYDKYVDDLAAMGDTPGNYAGDGYTMILIAFIMSPLIITTLVWSIVFFIMIKVRSKKQKIRSQ